MATLAPSLPVDRMPRKPKSDNAAKPTEGPPPPPKREQINFKPGPLGPRLDDVAEALGLDVSNLVRLILNENIAKYEQRAARIRSGQAAED